MNARQGVSGHRGGRNFTALKKIFAFLHFTVSSDTVSRHLSSFTSSQHVKAPQMGHDVYVPGLFDRGSKPPDVVSQAHTFGREDPHILVAHLARYYLTT